MKILQVNKYHYPRGGADRYYLDLGQRLTDSGHEVAYFAMQHPRNLATPWSKYFISRVSYNEQVWRYAWKIPGRALYSLEAKKRFTQLLQDFKPDIIHLHNIYHQLSPSILDAAAAFKIPVIMHLHDYKLICPNHALFVNNRICTKCLSGNYFNCVSQRCVKGSLAASFLAALEMYLHHDLLKIYAKNVDLFIAPSLFLKKMLIKAGWPENKIDIINNAFNPSLIAPANIKKENYFLYYGRLSPEKGIDLAIQALEANPTLSLKIAGTGPEDERLQTMGSRAVRDGRLDFLGWQEGEALAKLIAQAQAVLIPSRWLENFPLSALEALSLGTPVIAANIGGLPEIINEDNGCLIEPENAEALGQAMQDSQNKNKIWIKEKIKNSAAAFHPEINTAAVLTAYKKLLK